MQLIFFLVLLAIGGLFFLQNLQPIELIFFGGTLALQLPIALWILLFILAGLLTSLFLQALTASKRPASDGARFIPSSFAPPPRSVSPKVEKDPLFDDWEVPTPTAPEPDLREFPSRKVPQQPLEEEAPTFEAEGSPHQVSQNGTVYSYTYRPTDKPEPPRPEKKPAQPIYDANYRVIDNPPEDEDGQEWI